MHPDSRCRGNRRDEHHSVPYPGPLCRWYCLSLRPVWCVWCHFIVIICRFYINIRYCGLQSWTASLEVGASSCFPPRATPSAPAPAAFRSGPHCVATPESRMCASTTSAVASHAVMNGVPVPIVARLLGHADVRMTLRYAHLSDGDIAGAAERIGSAMVQLMEL